MKLLLTIMLITGGLTFAAQPEIEPKGKAYGLEEEFQNNMPEEVKEKVEALKALAEERKETLKELSDEEKKVKRAVIREEMMAKRAEILGKLGHEQKAKVEKVMKEAEKENTGKDEEMRKRRMAIEVLKGKVAKDPDSKGLKNALDHVQDKKQKQTREQ